MTDTQDKMNKSEDLLSMSKDDLKRLRACFDSPPLDPKLAEVCRLYKAEFNAPLGRLTVDALKELVDSYPFEWITKAVEISVQANKRSLNYLRGILRNWESGHSQPPLDQDEVMVLNTLDPSAPDEASAEDVMVQNVTDHVYLILARNGLTKIGKAQDPGKRFREIDSCSPVELRLITYFPYDSETVDLEKVLHRTFADKRVKGEWFALSFYDFETFFSLTRRYLTGEDRRLTQAKVERLYKYNLPASY